MTRHGFFLMKHFFGDSCSRNVTASRRVSPGAGRLCEWTHPINGNNNWEKIKNGIKIILKKKSGKKYKIIFKNIRKVRIFVCKFCAICGNGKRNIFCVYILFASYIFVEYLGGLGELLFAYYFVAPRKKGRRQIFFLEIFFLIFRCIHFFHLIFIFFHIP